WSLRQLGTEGAPALVGALQDKDPEIRQHAAEMLGALCLGDKLVVLSLVQALQDTDMPVRVAAVHALSKLGRDAAPAAPALVRVLTEANDPGLRRQAAMCLGNMGPAARDTILPALKKALEDPDANVRAAAQWAVQSVGNLPP